jgi:hypothetical protein
MTRRHLRKVRNIEADPNVSLVVSLTRRLLWFLPPPSIHFLEKAEILDWKDEVGTRIFESFFMGRQILRKYREASGRCETRICFVAHHARRRNLHLHGWLSDVGDQQANGIRRGASENPTGYAE